METFRILHCADIHLDSPLRGLEADPDAPADRIRLATRQALDNLVSLAIELPVRLVLIAGDLYDGDWQDWRTGLFLTRAVKRLTDAGIRVVAIRGNHDAESVITRRLNWPDGARLLHADKAETVRFEDLGIAVHGRSFADRAVTENLVRSYPAPAPGVLNIGLLHTSLNGRPGHDTYAPCEISQLTAHGYDYWALGHIHSREEVVRGGPWIVYPGNLQGRHARETGAKGATVITVADGRIAGVEHHTLDVVRWEQIDVDVTGAAEEEVAFATVRSAISAAAAQAGGRLLAARVTLTGECAAHAALSQRARDLREQLRNEANIVSADVWLEQVRVSTRPVLDIAALRQRDDAVGLLARHIQSAPADACEEVGKWAKRLLDRLPARGDIDQDHPALLAESGTIDPGVLAEARAMLLARLAEV